MRKFLCVVLALALAMSLVPAMALTASAASESVKAVRTAYFNNGSEWKLTDDTTGNDNILVASNGGDGWQAASSFTDSDGTVTSQASLNGTGFQTPRNALIAFKIPENYDASKIARVTLSVTIKNVKQVTSGVRLAVYGNSLDGEWSLSTGKAAFGDGGTTGLTCLGLTSQINTGNQTGETASGETVTLSSIALREYVARMAEEGKTEVTFRIATPLGGIRIYDYNQTNAPTLEFAEGEITSLNVRTVLYEGETVVKETVGTVSNLIKGETYTYSETPAAYVTDGDSIYTYSAEKSNLSVTVGEGDIVIAYTLYDSGETFSGYELTDEGAWCWFADPRSISYKNDDGSIDISIIGYIDIHGNIKATQINHNTNTTDEVLIRSNIQPDDHNNPTFLVLPDERIIVFYSRHTDEACFWYRVTKEKGDLTTLGEEKCLKTSANTTYPSPFLMKNDPDNIYLCWRGIGWHPTIAKLALPDENGDTHFTYGPYQMVQSTGARPYAKYASNGVDKIYVTYTTGHPDNEQPNWVYFNAINIADMTLEDINGNTLSTIASGTLAVNKTDSSQSFIVDTAPGNLRDWVWQTAIGADGNPVIAMVRISGGKTSHEYYYVKWNGTEWVKTFLADGGGSFHQTPGLEMCYSGGMAIDPDDTSVIYCSVPVEGNFGSVYEIIKYQMSSDGKNVVAKEQITKNSMKNNVRPFVIPNSLGRDIRLIWMNGDYYDWIVSKDRPLGYCTAVMTEKSVPIKEAVIDDAVISEDYAAIGGAFVSTKETANLIKASSSGSFTVSADVYLKGDGQILDTGAVKLGIEARTTRYGALQAGDRRRVFLKVNGKEYVSSNVYGSSDCWTAFSRGTGGNYGISDYEGYVNLTLTYDGEHLTLYRDGLIDEKVGAQALSLNNIRIGGFDGYVENVVFYDRALSSDEVKVLSDAEYTVSDPAVSGEVNVTCSYNSASGNEILPSKTVTAAPGTNAFIPKETITAEDGAVYILNEALSTLEFDGGQGSVNAIYDKYAAAGANLVTDGSFEDVNGNFSLGTWCSAETGEALGNPYETNHFYAVGKSETINAGTSTASSNVIPDGSWALGTRWNDAVNGLCSMMNFIEVEAGKTYIVSYDYKNKTDGWDASTIRTTFVEKKDVYADFGKADNRPLSVTTAWQTNTFAITAPANGYIYFHFYYLGSSGAANTSNSGAGPYWYFDDFSVREAKVVPDDIVSREIVIDEAGKLSVELTNNTEAEITNVRVFAATHSDETIDKVDAKTVSLAPGVKTTVELDASGKVSIYVWDENLAPICKVKEIEK